MTRAGIRAVLFDKDGTLVDFQRSWGAATMGTLATLANGDAGKLDALLAHARLDRATLSFDPASPVVAGSSVDFGPDWAAILGRRADAAFLASIDTLMMDFGRSTLAPIPGAIAAVTRAARAGPIGLATNDAEASAHQNLLALGIAHHFRFVAGYDSGFGAKPDPGMVHAFCDAVRVAPQAVAMVGDSLHDVATAKAAGALAIAVTTGLATHDELAPHADLMAADLDEALDMIGF